MKIKKIVAGLLCATVMMGVLGSCSSEKFRSVEKIKANGKLVVALEAGFAPMEYAVDGKIVGIDLDIADKIAEKLGVEVEVLNMEFNSVIPAIQSGKADIILSGFSYTQEREKDVDMSAVYMESPQMILVKAGSDIKSIEDLNGKIVAAQSSTTGAFYIMDEVEGGNLTCELKQFDKYQQCIDGVLGGTVDAVIIDGKVADIFVAQNPDIALVAHLFDDQYVAAVAKGNETLLAEVNNVIAEMIASGEIEESRLAHTMVGQK